MPTKTLQALAMRYDPIDANLFVKNREKLRALLPPRSIAILLANDIMPTNADGSMGFKQQTDLFYLCGIDQEDTALVLMPDAVDPRQREILFIKETNELIAIWEGEKLNREQAQAQSGVQRIEWYHSLDSLLPQLIPQAQHIFLLTNEHLRAVQVVETANDRFIKRCQARYPLHRYERLAPLLQQLRIRKEPQEVAILQRACNITEAGFRRTLGFIRPGVGEWEIEAELLHEFVRRGSRGFAYPPIVGSGKNACVLHYVDNDQRCQDGEIVLMDVAAEYAGWASDLTRSVPVNGRFTARQRQVYDAVLRVLRGANALLRPGQTPIEYQRQVVELMEAELIGLGLFSAKDAKAQSADKPLVRQYFMHGTSHHLGLDVHDVCPPHQVFDVGMVMTIEPGIYIREEKLGIRLENDVLIGTDSNHDLMASIPIEAEEIESLMQEQR